MVITEVISNNLILLLLNYLFTSVTFLLYYYNTYTVNYYTYPIKILHYIHNSIHIFLFIFAKKSVSFVLVLHF